MSRITPVILSGGNGSRLWPLSRRALPKQLLPLLGGETMIQQTLTRLHGLPELAPAVLVCNQEHRFLVAEQAGATPIDIGAIFLEPAARNTAPAIAVAALHLVASGSGSDGVMLVLPADHAIADVAAFHAAVAAATQAAEAGWLVTFGITPDSPQTGFGYIRGGEALTEGSGRHVAAFVEKPDARRAAEFLADGNYYWNSGMFAFRPEVFLAELEHYRPDILAGARLALEGVAPDLGFYRLDAGAFAACPAESIDYAVMEKTHKAVVIPCDIGWSDIGSWQALWAHTPHDASGNALVGDALALASHRCYARSGSRLVALLGVDDLIVVETADAVLVAHRDRAEEVKQLVDELARQGRSEIAAHQRVYRPWGWYEGVDAGERFQVKRIMVLPGERLSLQLHHHRAEHWVVVSGTARVHCDGEDTLVSENESTFIPLGVIHRLENPGKIPLHLIEVQSGSYLGEDDIVRLQDDYRREE
ncbi:mannose-1-phosphate guanylyltransferase/mannose-6-phosphate isomerase [Rhodocyclus tenuis]|uniref:mannose-1-phosphate guanylyltransferase n=1 Tax=Rhodocyclus gracilis TaxID=2929842 RepID=A0ABX0WG97_9RHOO|nr:mannose-1-phosphate guanylyltransferase/mannose-6-phosphate isomerase [Rhodocyclus gracilis]NJA88752.1 mannose-1-phosphate guanylyltransferase/mannose-6-phosphate isomerase [Rhodocyclus gracilis]